MSEPKDNRPVARVYIREWMEVRDITDQKKLATEMKRSASSVSKKLSKPELIDVQWLTEFAAVLKIKVPDLFCAPPAGGAAQEPPPLPRRARVADLMDVASRLSDQQIDSLISLFPPKPLNEPPQEHNPASEVAKPSRALPTR